MTSPTDAIQDHYEDPYHCGPHPQPTHGAEGENPITTDKIRIELSLDADGETVEEAWFQGEGGTLSQAAASMLMERIEGLTLTDVRSITSSDVLQWAGMPIPSDRHKEWLLAWRVLQRTIESPLDDDDEGGITFGGPSLGEES